MTQMIRTGPQSSTPLVASPRPTTAVHLPDAVTTAGRDAREYPTHRAVVVYVTGGLDGVLRVMTLLRERAYRVRDVDVDVHEGVLESRVGATAYLTSEEADLLLARLRRMPVVVSAEPG
ncbi:MAG: hypothetical protein J2P20_08675 [Pseudonocardia sp.]|nr:hypothetical protein [Pseudonocardia sp.]MBO0871928.1 hypothetical protein [Pseudonocardia sp.]